MVDRYALIDGDIFLYKSLFGAEETHDWGDGNFSLTCNLEEAAATFRGFMKKLSEKARADIIVCLSDPKENWRKDIWPDYKKPRTSSRKPINLHDLREIVQQEYRTVMRPRLEADDVMGILATGDLLKGKKLIVSIDKDMLQVPAAVYNPNKPDEGVRKIDGAEANRWHLFQALCGDVVDNYPGCPGIGEKRAAKLLDEAIAEIKAGQPETVVWEAIVAAFEKAGLTEDDALVQAQVARICRESDYDFKERRPIPWRPADV